MSVQYYYNGRFRKFLAFPPWVVVRMIPRSSLPETHPWKYKRLDWEWWHLGATNLSLQYGALLWLGLVNVGILIFTLAVK